VSLRAGLDAVEKRRISWSAFEYVRNSSYMPWNRRVASEECIMKDMEGNDRSLKKDSIPLFAGTE
jgi:hypothetical protein